MRRRRALLAIGLASLTTFRALRADVTATWNGSSNYWTTAAAWSGGVVPANNTPSGALYDVNINSGVVMFNPSSGTYTDTVQSLNLAGGQLSGPAVLTANAGFTFSGTNVWPQFQTYNVTFVNPAGASSTLAQNGFAYLPNAIFINNGTFNALSGSQLDAAFNNSGTLNVNGGSGTVYFGSTLNGPGPLNVHSGTLELLGYTPGTLLQQQYPSMAAGTTLKVYDYYAGQSFQQSENFFGFNSPNANYAVDSCKVSLTSNQSYAATTTQLNAAELDLYSTYASTSGLSFNNSSTLKLLSNGSQMVVTGALNCSGGATITGGTIYFNGSSASFTGTLQGSTGLVNNGTLTAGAGAMNVESFVNKGSLIVNPGTGGLFTENAAFNGSGTTYLQSGTLQVATDYGAANAGQFNVASGSTLVLGFNYLGTPLITGSGTVVFNTGSPSIGTTMGPVTLIINAAYTTCNATVATLAGLNVSGATNGPDYCALYGTGTLTVTGPTIINSSVTVSVNANGGLTFGPYAQPDGTTVNGVGQLASFTLGNTSYFSVGNSGVLINQGTFNCGSQVIHGYSFINTGVTNFNGSGSISAGFNNSGTVNFNSGGASPYIQGPSFTNSGTINLLAGNLTFNPTTYGVSNIFGGTLSVNSGAKATVILYPNQQLTASINGVGSLSIQGGGVIAPVNYNFSGTAVLSSTPTIAANNSFGSTGQVVDAGKVTLAAGNTGSISVRYIPSLTINASDSFIVQSSSNSSSRTLLSLGSLTLLGSLNLGNGDLQLSSGSLANITAAIAGGYNNGGWNGTGMNSSAAATDSRHLLALGVMQNNQSGTAMFTSANPFDGIVPAAGDILVKSTYYGDANLSGNVDSADYTLIDNGFLNRKTGWFNGDFNYDGTVNGSDYTLIDNAFNMQGAQISSQIAIATDQVAGATSISEPGVLGGVAVLGGLVIRRPRSGRVRI